jgi:hypothetical protein
MYGSPISVLSFAEREVSERGIWDDPRAEGVGFEDPWTGSGITGFLRGYVGVLGISSGV